MKFPLKISSDALVARFSRAGRRGIAHWIPVVNLVWLFWMLLAPWALPTHSLWMVLLTYGSLPLFLVIYFRAWYGPVDRLLFNTLAMSVLGLAMIPINTSWSYLIYACILMIYCGPPRRSLAGVALLLAAFVVLARWGTDFFSPVAIIAAVVTTLVLVLINLFYRINAEHDTELRLSHDEVRRLAALAERERIGRDLHDLLGHTLSLIAIKSELASRLLDRDIASAARELGDVQQVARDALAQVRSAVAGMRATGLAGEVAAARALLESSGVRCTVMLESLSLPTTVESAFALALREAVTNVHRHAGAHEVAIRLRGEGGTAELSIADDGRGGAKPRSQGSGLSGMRARLEADGGTVGIESAPGRGTIVRLRAPLQPVAPIIPAAPEPFIALSTGSA